MMKKFLVILLFLLLTLTFWQGEGGNETEPEIVDVPADSTSGKSSRDLLSAWFGDETNSSFAITIKVTKLEYFTPWDDIKKLPQTEYGVYFDFLGRTYRADAIVPIHGPLGLDVRYELWEINYNGTNVNGTLIGLISGTYDIGTNTIKMNVSKEDIGSPIMGDRLTNTWAMIRNKNWNEENFSVEDVAPDNAPSTFGKDYIFTGGLPGVYDFELWAEEKEKTMGPGTQTTFTVNVRNNSTDKITIEFSNSTPPKGWEVKFDKKNITLMQNSTGKVVLTLTSPEDAKNGTYASITVTGTAYLNEQTKISHYVSVKATVIIKPTPSPPPPAAK
ncbi:MAG: NEW3 domain-containing protein, partial [Candidatus Thermoplasmatota archaeon]